jgi:hypothetical protein
MLKKFFKTLIGRIIDWIYFKHWKIKTLIYYKKMMTNDIAMEIWISHSIIQRHHERRDELIERQAKIKEAKLFLEFVKNLKRI